MPLGHLGPDGVPPEVLMPDNPWEACQYVLIGQLSMLPVCKWSLFPVTQLCDLVFCSQSDHSSDSTVLAAWGVEGLEKVLLLGFDRGRNALQDDPRTCAYKQGQISPQNYQPLSKCLLSSVQVALVLIVPN